MHERAHAHRPLCTIELIVQGHAERCPGEACAFWEDGCVLSHLGPELELRPEVAQLLLDLRDELDHGRSYVSDDARAKLARILDTEEGIDRKP